MPVLNCTYIDTHMYHNMARGQWMLLEFTILFKEEPGDMLSLQDIRQRKTAALSRISCDVSARKAGLTRTTFVPNKQGLPSATADLLRVAYRTTSFCWWHDECACACIIVCMRYKLASW